VGCDLIGALEVFTVNSFKEVLTLEEVFDKHSDVFKDELGKLKGYQAHIYVEK
jgi:hypothetical protein